MKQAMVTVSIGFLLLQTATAAEFDCVIRPYRIVEVHAPAVGLIDQVHVDEGDVVSTGQELATLESEAERAATALAKYRAGMTGPIQTAQARAENSVQKFDRKIELVRRGFVTAEERDQASAEKKVAEAELHEARENRQLAKYEYRRSAAQLKLRTIKSPVSGVVTERLLNPGEVAELGVGQKPIVKVAQLDPLRVEVILPIRMFGKISHGEPITIAPESPIGGKYPVNIQGIDKVLDVASATFGVRLELPNPGYKLPAGIRCKASFPDAN